MKKIYLHLLAFFLFFSTTASSQVVLTGTSYLETFDNIGTALPTGWTVRTGATATAIGTSAALTTAKTAWSNTTGAFKNFASADGLTATSSSTDQNGSDDRSLGVRPTGSFGDPGSAFVLQLSNATGVSSLSATFKIQSLDATSARSITWVVDYAVGSNPTSFTRANTSPVSITTGGSTFSNTTVTANFVSALDNISETIWIRIVALSSSTGSGNRPSVGIDDFQLTYTQGGSDVTPPSILSLSPANNSTNVVSTLGTASILFNETVQKGAGTIVLKNSADMSVVQSIDVTTDNVTVNGSSITFPVTLLPNTAYFLEVSEGAFKDLAGNNFPGISGTAGWKFSTGSLLLSASFNICSSSITEGFTQYSVIGNEIWACTTFGRDAGNSPSGSAPNGVQINGFSGGTNVPNQDWLISPRLDLSSTTYPLLTFWSRTAFNGSPLQLKVSTNYAGSGDPSLATWTDINGRFPTQASDVWTASSEINLSAFKQPNVYVAFVYTSTNEEGARWTIDDITIDNSTTPPSPTLSISTSDIQFGYAASGASSTKSFIILANDITSDITLTSTSNFLLSSNGTDFSSSLTLPQASANNAADTVFIKFNPDQNDQNYTGTATVSSSGLTATIHLTATSIDPAKTLEIVNWNIEWFGSSANGPTNDSVQEQNVKKVLQNVSADLYGLVEIVDTARLGNIVRSMPGYNYIVSNFGSHTNPTVSGDGPLAEAQKLGFIYKTSIFSNISTTPLLNLTTNSAEDAASVNYQNWSSGRYPYMMKADVTLNGITKNIKFILVHAKANTSPTATSYARRKAGADSLYALLNRSYQDDNLVILGDFNDDLDSTITSGINPKITSYISFVNDSTNYTAVTLPLSRAGKKSTVSYNDMIDQVVVSNEMLPFYMPGSVNVLSDVTSLVSSYGSTTTDHYPVFTRYAFDATILPIKLASFEAVKNLATVNLKWKTAQEANAKVFIIQRSTDAIHFEDLGVVTAFGNSAVEHTYTFTDNNPVAGPNYYRLKQVDRDEKFEMSKILHVTFEAQFKISLKPNPAKNVVNILLSNGMGGATIQLLDLNGKVLKQKIVSNSTSNTSFSLHGMSKGTFLIRVLNDKTIQTQKLVID
ncbi:MAG TPA: choice-of-anchor J domain-containing protein [Segetibacter sp.]|nr:choice-of-anchor J domain-containing protein [Segetibacter sp.]